MSRYNTPELLPAMFTFLRHLEGASGRWERFNGGITLSL